MWSAAKVVLMAVVLVVLLVPVGSAPSVGSAQSEIADLIRAALPSGWRLHSAVMQGDDVSVCLEVPLPDLRSNNGMGIEVAVDTVRRALSPVAWSSLSVEALDPETGACRAVSDYAPRVESLAQPLVSPAPDSTTSQADIATRSLAGKTVYLSAGHGWEWTGSAWATQRIVYQDIIEDHNNAEAVDQYLIRYLENAGAKVIPVRERDWNPQRVIANNDQLAPTYTETGLWSTGVSSGYEGTDRYTTSVIGSATATATWSLVVPADGTYAVYAWVRPGPNRVPDAHYRVVHAAGVADVYLNQRIHPQTWRYLGTFAFRAGTAQVVLDNSSSVAGLAVMADAIRVGGGMFDSLDRIATTAPAPPLEPWWESATFYFSQWMGLNPDDWACYNTDCDFNDVVARPMYSRWQHGGTGDDAVFISWHTNGSATHETRGTVSYIHNGQTYPVTEGSFELATAVHTELVSDIRAGWDAAWADLNVRDLNLGELRLLWDEVEATRMPGTLLEIAFHDQVDDANALKDPRFNQLAARAVYQGIVKYFEGRDGVDLALSPEPPTHLSVRNLGGGAVRVDWAPSPADMVGLRGDPATGYRVYTSPDGLGWSLAATATATEATLTGLTNGQKLYLRVTATNDGGESFPTEVLGVRAGEVAHLLVVNGYDKLNRFGLVSEYDTAMGWNLRMWLDRINSRSYVIHHGDAVPAAYVWDSASNEAVASGLVDLESYWMVDWILGEEALEEDRTLNAAERPALLDYVNAGRALLISGSELAWDLQEMAGAPDFLSQVLHTSYVADDASTYAVAPVSGGAFAGLPAFGFDAPGEYDADTPDVLGAANGGLPTLSYSGGVGGTAAVQYESGCRRLLVIGFPFETIRAGMRAAVMARALDYLDLCAFPDTVISTPIQGRYYSAAPAFAGTASAPDLIRVEVQLQRGTAYWNGSGWGTAVTWLTAEGTQTWTYVLPGLEDGTYVVRARAIGTATDLTPAEVTFGVDSVPPQTPTPISPVGNVVLRVPLVPLVWSQPTDAGSPLRYRIELSQRVYLAVGSPTVVGLPSGHYDWRLRAEDAAGNVSAWSAVASFSVDVEDVYVPLVLRNH